MTYLGINDKYKRTTAAKDHVGVEGGIKEVNLSRDVPHLELHEGAVGDVCNDTNTCLLEHIHLVCNDTNMAQHKHLSIRTQTAICISRNLMQYKHPVLPLGFHNKGPKGPPE